MNNEKFNQGKIFFEEGIRFYNKKILKNYISEKKG